MVTEETGVQSTEPISLGNSINLHVLRTVKFKTAVCCLLIRRRLNREESTKNAVLLGVLKQGCAKFPSLMKINGRMDELYGGIFDCQIVKKGEEQIIQLYFEGVPKDRNITDGIEFLREVLLNPLTDGEGFKREITGNAVNNVKNAIEGRINNKTEYALNKCLAHMCEGEPFSVYADGYIEGLRGLDPERLYAHYKDILRTSPVELICAGDLDAGKLLPAARRLDIPGRLPVNIPSAECKTARNEPKIVSENFQGAQTKVCLGLRSDIQPASAEFFGLLMTNEILGGGPNSKLFTRIRDAENLCYYINSVLYRFKSIIVIQTGVGPGHFEHIIDAANHEIEDIRQGCVTRAEWESARLGLTAKFRGGLDHLAAILDFYTAEYLLNENNTAADFINRVETLTLDETVRAAKRVRLDTAYEMR